MLRIVAYVNNTPIDEVRILNTNIKNDKGEYKYKIIMPEHFEDVEVWHDRTEPWNTLAEKVIHELNTHKYDNRIDEIAESVWEYIKRKEKDMSKENKKN